MASERVPEEGASAVDPGTALRVRATWRYGPRTRAWDELWRWLLAEEEREDPGSSVPSPPRDP